ncbi:hypothetical protein GCM10010435_27160 [Winogradskya consettensis]|uniref:WXG100 family type VII secretion target n=1 Tax=Winogradskya consettensis TaxID=113560 RepID=A0A919SAQ5_9ACTN|nr:hypothetical protein [Actinoplanes consettensis]GIM68237.1 hypothetical protein Aco04nite_09950 [Actinoplanes consettensis]
MSDGRIKTLKRADVAEMDAAQKRYQHISQTIDDAVQGLQKIVDRGSEGLVGQWVEPLRTDATSIKDSLSKVAVRYHDVANEIERYEPELQHAMDEVTAAENDAEDGKSANYKALGMPDPQEGPDGTVSPEEQQKATDKQRAVDEASGQLKAATNRLTAALDALDVAGKRFGDAVNSKIYDDGLSDSRNDKIMAVFKKISDIFAIIALVLTVLAFVIPGLNGVAMAALVAGAVLLVSDSVLLANHEGEVLSVALDAIGLGIGGLGARLTKAGRAVDDYKNMLRGKVPPIGKPRGEPGGDSGRSGPRSSPFKPPKIGPPGKPPEITGPSGLRPPPLPKGLGQLPKVVEVMGRTFDIGVGLVLGAIQATHNPVVGGH